MAGHIITLTPTQWQELQNNESIVIGGVTYDYNEENLYMVVEPPYRVGDIVISTNAESPARVYGGTWEQLPEGYALWTATSGGGQIISAGLPNITGSNLLGLSTSQTVGGAFTQGDTESGKTGTGDGYTRRFYSFDASQSNSIYGNSTTVQPPAYKVYAWKRIGDNEV